MCQRGFLSLTIYQPFIQLTSVDESGFLFDSVFFGFLSEFWGVFKFCARISGLIIVRSVGTLLEA